jgi:hypothetical protein
MMSNDLVRLVGSETTLLVALASVLLRSTTCLVGSRLYQWMVPWCFLMDWFDWPVCRQLDHFATRQCPPCTVYGWFAGSEFCRMSTGLSTTNEWSAKLFDDEDWVSKSEIVRSLCLMLCWCFLRWWEFGSTNEWSLMLSWARPLCYSLIPARLVYVAESIVSDEGKTSQGRAFAALGRVCLVGTGLFWT